MLVSRSEHASRGGEASNYSRREGGSPFGPQKLIHKKSEIEQRGEKTDPLFIYISPSNAETLLANSIVQKVMLSFVFFAPTFCVAVVPLEEEEEEEERGGEAFSPGGGRRRRQKQQAVGEEGEER